MTEPGPQRPRVLVVDDQPPNIRLLEAILTPRGYDVRTASSGEEALEVIAGTDIDLVLLDIVMPGMDGYEVCRTDPRADRHGVPAGRHGDGQR